MALPFVLGLAVGAGAVVAFNKSGSIKEKACGLFSKSKDAACTSIEKGKETVSEVKETISATAECIKEKKAKAAESKQEVIEDKKEEGK